MTQRGRMNGFSTRRVATIAACLLIMGQSPHCARQEYVNYHFDLAGCPGDGFQMPDSAVRDEFKLYSTNREPDPPCPGFKLYDYVEDQKGFAKPDLGQSNVYVRLDRAEPCRLHVVLIAVPERNWEPEPWALTIAQLLMQGSPAQPRLLASRREQIGSRDDLEYWCGRDIRPSRLIPRE